MDYRNIGDLAWREKDKKEKAPPKAAEELIASDLLANAAVRGSFRTRWGPLPATRHESTAIVDMHEEAFEEKGKHLLIPIGLSAVVLILYGIAFAREKPQIVESLKTLSPLFLAIVEATEEAVYNSMLKATTVSGRDGHTEEAIPIDKVMNICKKYNVLNWNTTLPSWKKGESQ